jgi:hypothetical protein
MIDLVFFNRSPGVTTQAEKFLWAHELFHVRQYDEMGLEIVRKYYAEEFGFRSAGSQANEIEAAADRFACHHFRVQTPFYIGACP